MKSKNRLTISEICYTFLVLISIWCGITSIIQSFVCPKMTQTELFLHIPQSFICNFEHR